MSRLICLESVDSTNAYLRRNISLPHNTVVLADAQTAGRGRLQRSFFSAAGKGVYMSVLLHPNCEPQRVASLTPNLAVAVCRAINTVCGVMPEIKWVNDIYLKGKKICGILCESVIEDGAAKSVIAGIGVNVTAKDEDFPPELRELAGSVLSLTGREIERGRLALEIIRETDAMYDAWLSDERVCLEAYRSLCLVPGREILVITPNGEERAFAEGLSDDFGLIIRNENGRRTIRSGEISIKI